MIVQVQLCHIYKMSVSQIKGWLLEGLKGTVYQVIHTFAVSLTLNVSYLIMLNYICK